MIDFMRWLLLLGSKARYLAATSRGLLGQSVLLVPFFLAWASIAQAAVPPSEVQVLGLFYQQTGGPTSWTTKDNWNNASDLCSSFFPWFGVTCDALDSAATHVTNIALPFNNLVGTLPSLSGLTALQSFDVGYNHLSGKVPTPPALLDAGQSNLCGNSLVSSGVPATDDAWMAAQNPSVAPGGRWQDCQIPTCTLTATPGSISSGGSSTWTASCSPAATSYTWTGGNCAGTTGANCTDTPTATTTYTLTGSNSGGTSAVASATVTVLPPAPVCTLTATPGSISSGGSSTLPASCSPAATSYVWTGGTCAGTSAASCMVTPSATTTYTVAGVNSAGTGAAASATVTVISPPVCTLTATPASIYAGQTSTLTANCNPAATTYTWTGGACAGTTGTSCTDKPSATTTYTVAGVNSAGTGAAASATVTVIQPPTQAIPPSERAVLINLFASTNGASWIVSTNWNAPVGTECSWYGVFCDGALSHVINIALPFNNLVGTLPSLSGLTSLQHFAVDGNQLSGSIPPLSGLTALQYFSADGNQLTGSIPSLSGLTALQYFSVNGNQLTGSIPSLSGLTALQYFGVNSNQLTGSIPSLSGLTGLQGLGVGYNQLTGPVPAAPTSLLAGGSNLCDNSLFSSGNPDIDAAWVTAQNTSLSVAGGNWLACQTGYGTPTITVISQNYGSATISFAAPPAFTKHTVTCTAAGQPARTGTGTSSPITVRGLTGGVAYSCVVTSSNATTTSTPSEVSPVTANTVVPMMNLLLFGD